jgi:hypothetical protein
MTKDGKSRNTVSLSCFVLLFSSYFGEISAKHIFWLFCFGKVSPKGWQNKSPLRHFVSVKFRFGEMFRFGENPTY